MSFNNPQANPPLRSGVEFRAQAAYAAAQAAPGTEIKAAPTNTAKSHYVESMLVSAEVAGWIRLVQNTGGVVSNLTPKIYLPANGSGQPQWLSVRLKANAGVNIGVESSVAGNHSVQIVGFTAL